MNAREFILKNIDLTTKSNCVSDDATLISLPYPYTTPCIDEKFQEMYYWDTYFTHKCLLLTGREEQVYNNIENFSYMVKKFGKIPNGNRTYYLNRSQPPFFGLMIADYCEKVPAKLGKEKRFSMLKEEYDFWQSKRLTENGLNRYYSEKSDEECAKDSWFVGFEERTGIFLPHTAENGRAIAAECESGMDFSPRFKSACTHYNPVDLNCLLYADEMLLSKWSSEEETAQVYRGKAEKRKALMEKLMKAENGAYYDYDFMKKKRGDVLSFAAFYPFALGLSDDEKAFEFVLAGLEREYGIVASISDGKKYQWAEPNSWAPGNYMAFAAALRLNRKHDARRIAEKYISATDGIFARTGELWEKYNAETGGMDGLGEYAAPKMLGWTAGVYIAFYEYLKQ